MSIFFLGMKNARKKPGGHTLGGKKRTFLRIWQKCSLSCHTKLLGALRSKRLKQRTKEIDKGCVRLSCLIRMLMACYLTEQFFGWRKNASIWNTLLVLRMQKKRKRYTANCTHRRSGSRNSSLADSSRKAVGASSIGNRFTSPKIALAAFKTNIAPEGTHRDETWTVR